MLPKNIKQLIDAYFDHELSNDELRQFEEMLETDQEIQKALLKESYFYMQLRMGLTTVPKTEFALYDLDEAVILDQQMSQKASLMPSIDTSGTQYGFGEVLSSTFMHVFSSTKFLFAITLFSIGLFSLLLAMLIPWNTTLDAPNPYKKVTHISQTVDAVWGEGVEEESLNLLFQGTKLDLRSGLAQVEYKSGVRVNLEGPVIFVISGENEGSLLAGKLSAQMVAGAEEFAIKTPIGKVTDLGTEFGIIVDPSQNTDIQVFDGKVELAISRKTNHSVPLKKLELVETNAVRVDAANRKVTEVLYTPLRFARCYKNLRPYFYDDFSTDSSSNYVMNFPDQGIGNAAFAIEKDMLSIRVNNNTGAVISKRPLLGVGDIFMVDVPGVDPGTSEISAVVSVQPTHGNNRSRGECGFRFRREHGLIVEKFGAQSSLQDGNASSFVEEIRIDDPLYGKTIRLVIERRTETDFVFYYESNDGRTRITEVITNPELENFKRLHVGIEARSVNHEEVKVFDNLIVYPSKGS